MREKMELGGLWKYMIDPHDRGDGWFEYYRRKSSDPNLEFMRGFDKMCWQEMQIPGSWNLADPKLEWYEGIVWFAREFDLPRGWEEKHVTLRFDAVNYLAKVWLNDVEIGMHEGGYTPFEFDVTSALKPAGNLLMVKVHNKQLPDSTCPILPMANFGGIYREVSLIATGPARISWLAVLPGLDEQFSKATLTIKYEVNNMVASDLPLSLSIRIIDPDSKPVGILETNVDARAGRVTAGSLALEVQDPVLWDTDSPRLYRAEASLSGQGPAVIGAAGISAAGTGRAGMNPADLPREGSEGPTPHPDSAVVSTSEVGQDEVLDAVSPTFGIRKVEVKAGKICLNGRPVFLKGVGKHDDYPGLGRTIPDEIYRKDFEIIKNLGANAVRMAHYPHDERETAMADQLGFLLWEETLLVFDVDFKNVAVHDKVCQQLEELIRRDINHPSVIIWSLGNEIPTTTPEAEDCMRKEIEVVRKLDPTRLISFATWPLRIEENRPLKLIDVLSFNMYRGWYSPDIPGILDDIRSYHDAHPGKPIIVSEFGAGSMRGFHSESRDRWSEEYQEWVIEQNLEYMRKSPYLAGCFIWNYVDFKDPARPYSIYEPMINNKGLLDQYRVPKKAYATVARIFKDMESKGIT